MRSILQILSKGALISLADALDAGRLVAPFNSNGVRRYIPGRECQEVAIGLQELAVSGMREDHIAYLLRLVATERESSEHRGDSVELVWSGPEIRGSASRDTGVVVRELFAQATRSVLISGFALHRGRHVFKVLAGRMDEVSELSVRMFLNIGRVPGDETADVELIKKFVDDFRNKHWPSQRLPEVFYDPRSLVHGYGPKASLHAKCVVVDDERAFVTSANFTEAAQERNIEAGVLIRDATFAKTLRAQFENLVLDGALKRVPGIG